MMRDFVAGFSYQDNIATLNDDILKIAGNETQEKIKGLKTNYAILVVVIYDVTLNEIQDKELQKYTKRGRYIDANQSFFQEKLFILYATANWRRQQSPKSTWFEGSYSEYVWK